jgi:bacterioferritin
MSYLTNSIVLDGVRAQEVEEGLRQDATQGEPQHAEMRGERVRRLDARPPASMEFEARQQSLQLPEDPRNVLSVIDGVIEAENAAIETYRSLIDAAEAADDPVTEDRAVTILTDEEAHRAEFRSYRREYGD